MTSGGANRGTWTVHVPWGNYNDHKGALARAVRLHGKSNVEVKLLKFEEHEGVRGVWVKLSKRGPTGGRVSAA